MTTYHTSGVVAFELCHKARSVAQAAHAQVLHPGHTACAARGEGAYWPHVSVLYGVGPSHLSSLKQALKRWGGKPQFGVASLERDVTYYDHEQKQATFLYTRLQGVAPAVYALRDVLCDLVSEPQITPQFVPHVSFARLPYGARISPVRLGHLCDTVGGVHVRLSRLVVRSAQNIVLHVREVR